MNKFNLTRFNAADIPDGVDMSFERDAPEGIYAEINAGKVICFSQEVAESLPADLTLRPEPGKLLPFFEYAASPYRYNIMPFNRRQGKLVVGQTVSERLYMRSNVSKVMNFECGISENISAEAVPRTILPFKCDISESLNANITPGKILPVAISVQEDILCSTQLRKLLPFFEYAASPYRYNIMPFNRRQEKLVPGQTASERLYTQIHGSKVMHFKSDPKEIISATVCLRIIVNFKRTNTEFINAVVIGSKTMNFPCDLLETINCISGAAHTETVTMSLNVSIPAGAELRIDSDRRTILLILADGTTTNIRYVRVGDWINLDPDSLRLIVNSTANNLTGELIYDERFL